MHYHILWIDEARQTFAFDFESHATEADAHKAAGMLARYGETWSIVEVDGCCKATCLTWLARHTVHKAN